MDTHRFIVGSLSDIEGDNKYSNNLGEDDQTAAPFRPQPSFSGFDTNAREITNTKPSLPGPMRSQTLWDPTVMPQKSVEGETIQPSTMYFNPSLEVSEPFTLPEERPSATPATRSINNSLTLRQLKSPATSTLTTTPTMSPPEASPRTTTRPQRKPRRVKTPPEDDDEEIEDSVTVAGSEDLRREKNLERNRVAASKCRQKKKIFVADLEETKLDLEETNSRLQTEFKGLQAEVFRIKDELRSHANCYDDNINRWIDNEARKFVYKTKTRFGSSIHQTSSAAPSHRHLPGGRIPEPIPIKVGQHQGGAGMMDPAYGGPMFAPGPGRETIAYSQAPTLGLSTTVVHPEFPGMGTRPSPLPGGLVYGHMPGNMF